MKSSFRVAAFCYIVTSFTAAFAQGGGNGSGGGDLCEDRVKIIKADLRDWIARGGPAGLNLPKGVTPNQYSIAMLKPITTSKIQCVGVGDKGFPVTVDNVPKACRFDGNSDKGQITCDFAKLKALSESDQYVLVHHELAGLAGLESPDGADSHYDISNQISEYLVDTVVKKLAVKPGTPPGDEIVTFKARVAVDVMSSPLRSSMIDAASKTTGLLPYSITLKADPDGKRSYGTQEIQLVTNGALFDFYIEVERTTTGYTYYIYMYEDFNGARINWVDFNSLFNLPTSQAPTMHMQGTPTQLPDPSGKGLWVLPMVNINGDLS